MYSASDALGLAALSKILWCPLFVGSMLCKLNNEAMSISEESGSDGSTQHFPQLPKHTAWCSCCSPIYTACGKTGDIWTQQKAFWRTFFFKRKVIVWMLYITWLQCLWSETRFTTASHLPLRNREIVSQSISHQNHHKQTAAAGCACLEAPAAQSSPVPGLVKHLK